MVDIRGDANIRPECPGASNAGLGDCAFACGAADKAAATANMRAKAKAEKRLIAKSFRRLRPVYWAWNVRLRDNVPTSSGWSCKESLNRFVDNAV